MYKKIILLAIIFLVITVLIFYAKNAILYLPMSATRDKYDRFFSKLFSLVENQNYIISSFVKTVDGALLDTVYIKNPDSSKCIIFFHGNAGNITMRFDMIKFLYNYASIVIFDYRSFGKSSGDNNQLSSKSMQKDAEAIWNYTRHNLGYCAEHISLFGESLGCAVIIQFAAELSKKMNHTIYPHSLILNSPFYSLTSMIEHTFGKINIKFLGKILSYIVGRDYQSNEFIKFINHKTKIIIAHSPKDEIVPYKEGWNLYTSVSQINKNIKFVNITGTHNNLGLTDNYIYSLSDLFDE